MKKRNTFFRCLPVLGLLLSALIANAQTFPGNIVNTAGNSAIPSAGTGGCTVAPQTTGGTIFENPVAGLAANAQLLSVMVNFNHTFTGDIDMYLFAPNGQILELSTDNGGGGDNFTNTVFCDAAAISIVGQAAPFTGIFRPEGSLTSSTCGTNITPTVQTLAAFTAGQNGIWQLVIKDDAGAGTGTMLGWSLSFGDPACTFAGVVLPALTITGVDAAVCGATNTSVTAPSLACSSPITVYVDGTQLTVVNPGQSYIIPSLVSGAHTLRYELSACDFVEQAVNVVDGVPPSITCPANITYNLAPGACDIIHSYTVDASDNCPGPIQSIHQNLAWPTAIDIALVCSNAAPDFLSYYRLFNITQNINAVSIDLGVWRATPGSPFTIKLYSLSGAVTNPINQANLTLLSTTIYDSPAIVNTSIINIPLTNTPLTAGTQLLVEVGASGTATPQSGSSVGFDLTGETAPTYVFGCFNTAGVPAQITGGINDLNFFSVRGLIMQLNLASPAVSVVQTAGLPSGATFPIGKTTNCFTATDAAGNTSTCCFDVTVLEYPNPISTLICNDLVYVSLDADCTEALNADQILEGGPYGCYNDYIVQLDKTPPYGNGPWVPAVLGPQDIGKTYAVQVIDPDTGNKCWGNVKVEDKLAPVLDCQPQTAVCNQDLTPGIDIGTIFAGTTTLPTTTQTTNNSFNGITFDVQNVGAAPLMITGFRAPVVTAGTHPVEVYYTTTATTAVGNQATAGAWTLLGTANVDAAAATPFALVPVGGLMLAPGESKGIYIAVTDGSTFAYANNNLTTTDGKLSIISQGHSGGAYPFINANNPRAFIGAVLYSIPLQSVGFPNGLTLNVDIFQTGPTTYTVPAGSGTPVLENCSDVTLSYQDASVDQNCASGLTKIVNRKWTAVDGAGNTKTCIQVISVLRPTMNDVVLPPDYDDVDAPALPCGTAYPTPDLIEGLGLQGYPYVFGSPDGCSIGWTYTDSKISVCDGTYKILREWKIIDWCAGTHIDFSQIIKVLDDQGPTMSCPANVTVSTDPFTCCATTDLPDVIISDNCSRINNISGMIIGIDPSNNDTIGMFPIGGNLTNFPGNNLWNPDTLGAFGLSPCLPQGTHTVVYQAEDDCGNTTTCTFRITVRDFVPPVAACDEHTIVSIGLDDPFDCYGPEGPGGQPAALGDCDGAGVTWVKAKTFDDGSYDNCNNIKFTIQRMADANGSYSDCILGLNSLNGHPSCDDFFPDFPSEFERAVSEGDSIKFYCCEVGTSQMVILRVYQLDAFGNLTIGPDGSPIQNSCMVEVEVQDKIKPVCVTPGNVTVSCESFDPSLWAYGKPSVYDNCCLDTSKVYQGQCGLEHSVNYNLFDTLCNKGTITRTFRVYDCHGQSNQCTQRIVVNYEQDYFVKFPNDVIVTVCDGTGMYGEPTFFGKDCELWVYRLKTKCSRWYRTHV
ncbi:MAG: HYR domain-containing protein [Saprospiraceae bacterium]